MTQSGLLDFVRTITANVAYAIVEPRCVQDILYAPGAT